MGVGCSGILVWFFRYVSLFFRFFALGAVSILGCIDVYTRQSRPAVERFVLVGSVERTLFLYIPFFVKIKFSFWFTAKKLRSLPTIRKRRSCGFALDEGRKERATRPRPIYLKKKPV